MTDRKRPLPRDTDFYALMGSEPISDQAAFTEIANAILHLRRAFILAGFSAPIGIEMASHDDGYRLRHILPRDMVMAFPGEAKNENDTDVIFNICGLELRYPARFREFRNGRKETI